MDQENDPFDAFRSKCKTSTSRTYDLHREAVERQDWLAAGVWGSIFLEAFLDEACRALGARPSGAELGDYINRLRGLKESPNVQEVVGYCETLRNARNGLMHAREDIDPVAPSKTIENYLPKILALARLWFTSVPVATAVTEVKLPQPIGRVFVSTITPHLPGQGSFLRDLQSEMRNKGLEPVHMQYDAYDARDPVSKVVNTIKNCAAFLAVGLSRSHAYYLKDREGSSKEEEFTHRFYTSGWLHMEAGVAYGLGKRVFTMCEENLTADGIFDRSWNSSPPFVLTLVPVSINDPVVKQCLDRLHAEIRKRNTPLSKHRGRTPSKKIRRRNGVPNN